MRSLGLAVIALAGLTLPGTSQAQTVTADIAIHQGPISGRVIIGDRYHPRPHYREYVVVRHYRGGNWYHRHGYRPHKVYWDGHRYYDRPYRSGLRVVYVYERGGRYYHDYRNDYRRRVERRDDRHDRWDDDYRGKGHDRDDDRHERNDRDDYRGRTGHR